MKLLIPVLILVILASCTKFGKNVTVKGRVLNPVTGAGIEGAEVKLLKISGGYDSNYKTIKSVTTDASGNFELDKCTWSKPVARCELGDFYKLGWTQDGGQTFIDNFELDVKKGKVMHADYYAVPYGNLILNIQNVNCGGSVDTMYFRKKWVGYSDVEGSDSTPRTGCYSYTSPSAFQIPMGTYVYEMKVIRSGITTYVYDTIVVPKTGVVTINMDY